MWTDVLLALVRERDGSLAAIAVFVSSQRRIQFQASAVTKSLRTTTCASTTRPAQSDPCATITGADAHTLGVVCNSSGRFAPPADMDRRDLGFERKSVVCWWAQVARAGTYVPSRPPRLLEARALGGQVRSGQQEHDGGLSARRIPCMPAQAHRDSVDLAGYVQLGRRPGR